MQTNPNLNPHRTQEVLFHEAMDLNKSLSSINPNAPSSRLEGLARFTARNPRKALVINLVFAFVISTIAVVVGDFKIEADNKGWRSRGTPVSDREIQVDIMNQNLDKLFRDEDGSEWNTLKTELQMGYVDLAEREVHYERKRNLLHIDPSSKSNQQNYRSLETKDTCSDDWYGDTDAIQNDKNIYAVWSIQQDDMSILDAAVMKQICTAEVNTLKIMQDAKVCHKCNNWSCMKPLSLVFMLRARFDLLEASCNDLIAAYTAAEQEAFTLELVACTNEYKKLFDSEEMKPGNVTTCPYGYMPNLVDYAFGVGGNTRLSYTSSYFRTSATAGDENLYDASLDFDGTDGEIVVGVYDTAFETFNEIEVDELMIQDMVSRLSNEMIILPFSALTVLPIIT